MQKKQQLALVLVLVAAGSMWFYVERILIPHQKADAVAHNRPRGNLSDLYPRWLGARELLLNHRDPYSPEVTREIQVGYYGRPLDPSRAEDPKDQQAFAYPVYVVFLLAPTVNLPFPLVKTSFEWFLIVLTAGSILLWLRALRWRPPLITVVVLIVLTLGSFPAVQGIKRQQLSLLVSGLIAASAALVVGGQLVLAGVGLALASIKPQLALPLSAWLLLWGVSDWRARQRFVWGFAGTLVVLLGGAEWLLPAWIPQFQRAVMAYREYTSGAGSLLDVLTTPSLGSFLTVLLLLMVAAVCGRTRRASSASPEFALTTSLVLAVTVVVVPMPAPYNQVLLLPAICLLVREPNVFLPAKSFAAKTIWSVSLLTVLWPWLAAAGLTLASFLLSAETVQRAWVVPLFTSFAIPLAIVSLLLPSVVAILRPRPASSLV